MSSVFLYVYVYYIIYMFVVHSTISQVPGYIFLSLLFAGSYRPKGFFNALVVNSGNHKEILYILFGNEVNCIVLNKRRSR